MMLLSEPGSAAYISLHAPFNAGDDARDAERERRARDA